MQRLLPAMLVSLVFLISTQAKEVPADFKGSLAYIQKLQTKEGGFVNQAPATEKGTKVPSATLKATSSALRALRYFGGNLSNKDGCAKFVESCFDPETGGFADVPKGKPDVFTTAVGLMAVTELKLPTDKYGPAGVQFLSANSKGFEDIRIAVAGLERLEMKSPKNATWLEEVVKLRNPDGTFGKGPGQARATGGTVVTLLRLGTKVDDADSVLKVLKAGQRDNGGYGKDEDPLNSDLETTYRVMRCFHMLKARPSDVEGLRSFVAKCRNEDGGYGLSPGQPSSIGPTYFAAIIRHWLEQK